MFLLAGAARRRLLLGAVACALLTGCGSPVRHADQTTTAGAPVPSSAASSGAVPTGSSTAATTSHPRPASAPVSSVGNPSASPATTGSPASTSAGRVLPSPVLRARTAAAAACSTWQRSETQDAPTASQADRAAAATAAGGAALDSRWRTLAADMHFVAALPETGNPPSTVATARADLHVIQQTCAALGVRITT